ncbi:hypothetical protein SH2C18_32460 [Clostridium sediminicola]|uniref:diguanylate cyclase n=1 Tax=Clostridium sediminicola TaxID=3114879 RepID=UPI0031F1E9E7
MFRAFLSNIYSKITNLKSSIKYFSLLNELHLIGGIEFDYKKNRIILGKELEKSLGIDQKDNKYRLSEFIDLFVCKEFRNELYDKLSFSSNHIGYLNLEMKINTVGNEKKWVNIYGKFYQSSNGKLKNFKGIIQDISSFKKKENRLESNVMFMQKLIDTIPTPIFYKDNMGVYRLCNSAFKNFYGMNEKEIIGHTAKEISPNQYGDIYYNADKELMMNSGKQVYESKVRHADNTDHVCNIIKTTFDDDNDKTIGIVGVMIDITDRKNSEEKLNNLLALKQSVVEITHTIMDIDNIKTLFDVILEKALKSIKNARIGAVLLLDEEGNLTLSAHKGYAKELAEKFSVPLNKSLTYRKTNGNIKKTIIIENIEQLLLKEYSKILDNEGQIFVKSSISSPIIVNGKLYGLLNIDSEKNNVFDENDKEFMEYLRIQIAMVIEKRLLYEKMIQFSRYDELTGVYNRRYFEERLENQLEKSQRYSEKFCLILFDLNKFKNINDTFGHIIGDEVLKNFSNILKDNFRSSDIIGRFGGDEFVALIYNDDKNEIVLKLKRVLEKLRTDKMSFNNISLNYSFSYGIACYPQNGISFNELIKDADKKMYENKRMAYLEFRGGQKYERK